MYKYIGVLGLSPLYIQCNLCLYASNGFERSRDGVWRNFGLVLFS